VGWSRGDSNPWPPSRKCALRRNWLDAEGASGLEPKRRTLKNPCNARPAWPDNAHEGLDEVAFAAYGWPTDIPDGECPENLTALNPGRSAGVAGRRPGGAT